MLQVRRNEQLLRNQIIHSNLSFLNGEADSDAGLARLAIES